MAVWCTMNVDAPSELLIVVVVAFSFFLLLTRGGNAQRTLTVLALGDREPLGRYGLVRSGIIRNG